MLMSGPPGGGKTLIARPMPGILPRIAIEEALDVIRIYAVADQFSPDEPLIRHRPFRAPHQTVSYAGHIGGGRLSPESLGYFGTGDEVGWQGWA